MLPTLALALLEEASRLRFWHAHAGRAAPAPLAPAPLFWWKTAPGAVALAAAPVLLWCFLEAWIHGQPPPFNA